MAWEREYDYDQAKDFRWARHQISKRGACQALSIYWVIKNARGEDFVSWLAPPKVASSYGSALVPLGSDVENKIVRVMQQQDKVFNAIGGDRNLNMDWASDKISAHEGYGNTDLTKYGALVHSNGPVAQQMASEVVKRNGYKIIGWYLDGWGGHLTAGYVRNNETWFFDPNFGQYKFSDKPSFMTWFKHTLFCMNYGIYGAMTCMEIQHFH